MHFSTLLEYFYRILLEHKIFLIFLCAFRAHGALFPPDFNAKDEPNVVVSA